jgi:hypothetical protein
MKASGNIDSLTGKFFANSVGAIDTALNQVLDKVGAVKGW